MIIWGSKTRFIPVSQGSFSCPACASSQPFTMMAAKRYFTLYFIPLFPTSTLGNFVRCNACSGEFHSDILSMTPEKLAEAAEKVTRQCVNLAICAGASVGGQRQTATSELVSLSQHLGGAEWPSEQFTKIATNHSDALMTLQAMLTQFQSTMDGTAQERVLQAAHAATGLSGADASVATRFVENLGAQMRMSPTHIRAVLSAGTTVH